MGNCNLKTVQNKVYVIGSLKDNIVRAVSQSWFIFILAGESGCGEAVKTITKTGL